MRSLSTMTRMNLEKVINNNKFYGRPFVFWDNQEVEELQNPLDVLTVLDEPPNGWKEENQMIFHPVNPKEFRNFKKWAIRQIDASKNETGFAIISNVDDYINVQAFTH